MREPFVLDPINPPEGETDAAVLALWRGNCPWCDVPAPFAPSELFDGSVICRACGLEFAGISPEEPEMREITTVYVEGDAGMRAACADDLPAAVGR